MTIERTNSHPPRHMFDEVLALGGGMTIERTNSHPLRPRALVGLLLIPLLIAGGLFVANWGATGRSHEVRAAVVNLDKPVTVNGQYTPLGRQLTAALVDSKRTTNLTWVLESDKGAADGLASGKYAASVTIPADFSASATSFGGVAGDARKAVVDVQTSPVAGVADATLGKVVAREAVDALNATLTSSYLDQVYVGFNTMGEQFATVADGAKELSDGVSEYTKGVGQASDGASKLTDGAIKLADGLDTMYTQTTPLPGGLKKLSDGLGIIKTKTKPMPGQVKALADGLQGAATGTTKLADGAGQLADGISKYVGGVNQVVEPVIGVLDANPQLIAALDTLNDHAGDLETALNAATDAIAQIQKLAGLSPDKLAGQLPAALSCERALGSVTVPDGVDTAALCALYYQGLAAGIDQANQQLIKAKADGSLDKALADAKAIADAAKNAQLPGGASGVVTQLKDMKAGGDQLVSASAQLADGTTLLADGSKKLADGVRLAADGTSALAAGMPKLVDGIAQSADGVKKISDKMPKLVDGIGQSADGARKLADGLAGLSDGLGQATDNGPKLTDGAKQLADGLAEGQSQLPHYSDSDRATLSSVVAGPIDTSNLVGTAAFDAGWASLLLVLALWLGALATFSVVKALAGWVRTSAKPTVRVLAEALVPGVAIVGVQAVIVTMIGEVALLLPPAQIAAVLAIMIVGAAAFALVNQALVAWFSGAGRVVSVALAVLAAADLVTSASPSVFGALRMLSPLSPAIDAIRAVVTGSSGVAINVAGVVGWLAIGGLAAAIAVLRSRTTTFRALASA